MTLRMIRKAFIAALLLAAAPALAQAERESIDTRYDRALAAGYKALMMCGAIKNAEALGSVRTVESVEANELVGTYPELDAIVDELEVAVQADHVSVAWDDTLPPRIALSQRENGCSLLPIGAIGPARHAERSASNAEAAQDSVSRPRGDLLANATPGAHPRLDATLSKAFDGHYGQGTNTTAVVVVRNGEVLTERYKEGFGPMVPQRTWSVAKSIAATLVGAAVQRGEVSVDQPAPIAAWSKAGDPRGAITLDHLLRMASGRYSDTPGNRTDPVYFGGATVDERAAAWPLIHPPGSVFRYANNDTLMAVKAIAPGFAPNGPRELFQTLGMNSTIAETDWQGNYILSSQVWSTARDLAKLGMLYLENGAWNGARILPEDWRNYVSAPSGPQPDGPFGYGAGFWLLNRSEGVPADTIAAMGNRGQFIIIIPSMNIVLVRRGEDPAGSRFDIAEFTREVLENTIN